MRVFKWTLLTAAILVAVMGAMRFGAAYWTTVGNDLDEKAEWSILQAAYQANKRKKPESCLPISYLHKNSKAIGFWSSQGWVWILMPSRVSSDVKVLPEGVKFYLPKSGIEAAIDGIDDPGVVKYIRENSVPGCP